MMVALTLFWLSRCLFYLFNIPYFSQLSFWELSRILLLGLRFDIAGLLMLNFPFLLMMSIPLPLRRFKWWRDIAGFLFYTGNILGLMVNFMDVVYFRFTQKRMTGDIFAFAGDDVDLASLMPQFVRDYWPYQLAFLAFAVLLVIVSRRVKYRPRKFFTKPPANIIYPYLAFLFTIAIIIIGIRGGLQLKPINIITAGKVADAQASALVLNTPFTIIKTLDMQALQPKSWFEPEECRLIYSPVHYPQFAANDALAQKPLNVVILIIESLSSEHIGAFNRNREGYQGFTPFLDSLIPHALTFRAFANGKQSIEGIPSILASLPSLMDRPYINSAYASNKIQSLAAIFNAMDYNTAFYHGGTNGTMDFDGFADMAGFQHYYGRTEYNNDDDFDGNWGIFDEPFYHYFNQQLTQTQVPFFATFFSLSSHHPYTIPEKYEGKFRSGKLEIQQSIMYADFALGRFFAEAARQTWYPNTLFVITADHTSEAWLPEYKTRVGMYRIPVIFYAPGLDLKSTTNKTAAQIDIMPTVLGLLNYPEPYLAFGHNLLDDSTASFTVNYINGVYQMIENDFVLQFDGEHSVALFNFEKDSLLQNNLLDVDIEKAAAMERTLKAYIQQYNKRMIENKLAIGVDGSEN